MNKLLFALICAGSCLWAQEGTGPFPAVMEQDPGLPTHTIYRPKDLVRVARAETSDHCLGRRRLLE